MIAVVTVEVIYFLKVQELLDQNVVMIVIVLIGQLVLMIHGMNLDVIDQEKLIVATQEVVMQYHVMSALLMKPLLL